MMQAQQRVAWGSTMAWQRMRDLQGEVVSGRCVLVESPDGFARRVVGFTGERVQREDGCVLAVLAKKRVDDPALDPDGQLPGVKQDSGDLPCQALRRVLGAQLRPFAEELHILHAEREDRHEHSKRYGIETHYIRVLYSATLQSEVVQPAPGGTIFPQTPFHDRTSSFLSDVARVVLLEPTQREGQNAGRSRLLHLEGLW